MGVIVGFIHLRDMPTHSQLAFILGLLTLSNDIPVDVSTSAVIHLMHPRWLTIAVPSNKACWKNNAAIRLIMPAPNQLCRLIGRGPQIGTACH